MEPQARDFDEARDIFAWLGYDASYPQTRELAGRIAGYRETLMRVEISEIDRLEVELENAEAEIDGLEDQLSITEGELADAQGDIDVLRDEVDELREQLEEKE